MRNTHKRIIKIISIVIVLVLAGTAAVQGWHAYRARYYRANTFVFSQQFMLEELWGDYKRRMLEKDTYRTMDASQGYITTSEGQSYTMLRAVWMGDKDTFDKSWQWTKDILQREDSLFAWKFGQLADGSYGIQTDVGGQNSAVDADTDIALSLLMAYARWNQTSYAYDALPIVQSLWDAAVIDIQGKPVLAANDLEKTALDNDILINPSYFAPYSYKLFSLIDRTNNWLALADNSYAILQDLLDEPDAERAPPNWVYIDRVSGAYRTPSATTLTTDYGYDAIRIPWRLALDYEWFKDDRARTTLQKFSFLRDSWLDDNAINDVYDRRGLPVGNNETPAAYGAALGYFKIVEPDIAKQIYERKLVSLYNIDTQEWRNELRYYDDNWAWFGMALLYDKLPNIALNEG